MQLTKRKPTDALDQPIKPDTIYTPLLPFAGDLDGSPAVWNPDRSRLRGDHPAVQKYAQRFIPDGLDSPTVNRLRAARLYPPSDEPPKPKPAPAIPPEREAIASETFWSGDGFVHKGSVRDDRSPIVQRNPTLFHRRPQPIKPPEAA